MIVGGLHSRAVCPTALHLLHSRNGHEPDFCRWPGVLHSVQYFEQFELPVTMRFGTAMIAHHARNGSYACRCFLCVIRLSLSRSLRFRGA